ncbi:MAG: hypothetical protein HKN23_00110 [Verrucomicrobiales bacterium]|nr:hypothetical protein [Verrucomicrobiales bacterium]
MCNLYDIGPSSNTNLSAWQRAVREAIEAAPKEFGIRKTDPGIVARLDEDGSDMEPVGMRWGFHREFNPAINNARSDKLSGRMWNKAWREKRRCLIPVSTFYEWSGPTGSKLTHAFQGEDAELWMGGLWEKNSKEDIGSSYTMLTTNASDQVSQIHNRMPAILRETDFDEFLNGENPTHLLEPFSGDLKIFDCENPLRKKPEDHQGPVPIAMLPGFE